MCKRVARRMQELDLKRHDQYRETLEANPDEWNVLEAACRITISRFYRDKNVFDTLGHDVLPGLAAGALKENRPVRCWCAGCASGEEAYTLAILWDTAVAPTFPTVNFEIVATDADPHMLSRAKNACFSRGSLKEIPAGWFEEEFTASGDTYCVDPRHRQRVTFLLQDIREEMPQGEFDLILCRNLVFTYFAASLQAKVLRTIKKSLLPDGYLVIGAHEALPREGHGFRALEDCREVLQRRSAPELRPRNDDRAGGGISSDMRGLGHANQRDRP